MAMTSRERVMQAHMAMLVDWDAWADRVAELCDAAEREVALLDRLGGHEATARDLEAAIDAARRLG